MATDMVTLAMGGNDSFISQSPGELTTHWHLQPKPGHSHLPPMPLLLRFCLAFFLMTVFFIGSFGNLTVIWIFYKTRNLRTPPNMLIINLAVSDFIMVITEFPIMFISVINGRFIFGELGCDLYAFAGAMFGVLSISTLTTIAFDRFYAICSSLDKLRFITYGRAGRLIAGVWIYSLFWAIFPFFGIGDYVLEGYGVSCTFHYLDESLTNQIYVGFLFVGDFLFPLFFIVIFYARIVNTVRQNRIQLADIGKDETQKKADKKADKKDKNKKKRANAEFAIAKIGMTLTALFVLSWMPYATVAFIGEYIDPGLLSPMVQTIPVVLAKSSAIWNPIVYAISHKKFKEALTDKFLAKCCGGASAKKDRMGDQSSVATSQGSISEGDTLGRQSTKRGGGSQYKPSSNVAVISTNEPPAEQTKGIIKDGSTNRDRVPLQVRLSENEGENGDQGIDNAGMDDGVNNSEQLTRM